MRIALLGTRGVPARYGGFETAAEEIGRRLVGRGHEVVVYCRTGNSEVEAAEHDGMALVTLPAVRAKSLETLSHTGVSVAHLVAQRPRPDAAVMFNAGNAVYLPPLRVRGIPVATHVDGLEWQRSKWAGGGRRYYRMVEGMAVRWSDALIADAAGIADYYRAQFDVPCEQIAYGAPILGDIGSAKLADLGLAADGYHLVVARFEPENHVLEIVRGYRGSKAAMPLVVVGSAPYAGEYTAAIEAAAAGDERVRLVGGVWDQELLDQLYAHARTYLHGHSVGGTNPSLLRAMGAGTATIAWDVVFNAEVLGAGAILFDRPDSLASAVMAAEADPVGTAQTGVALARRAGEHYVWDDVAAAYEAMLARIAGGDSIHPKARRARRAEQPWTPTPGE